MKTTPSILLAGLAVLSVGLFTAQPVFGQTTVTFPVTDPTNAVWDLSAFNGAQDTDIEISNNGDYVRLQFASPFEQTGGGKFLGSGSTTVSLEYDSSSGLVNAPPFTGTYVIKGAITSSKGVTRISFTSTLKGSPFIEGQNRAATASFSAAAVINPITRTWTGRTGAIAKAVGLGNVNDSDTFSESIPPGLGDGSWTLVLNFNPSPDNKVTGTATVTLKTGKVLPFDVKGGYNPKKGETRVTLRGKDAGLGSSLQVVLVNGQVKGVSGKISGQTIKITGS
jgi:hypothetical protein